MSMFPVRKSVIVEAATKAVCDVETRRMKALNELINQRMNRWFFPCDTREAALKEIKDIGNSLSNHLEYLGTQILGRRTMDTAKTLLSACQVTQAEVIDLDTNDAAFVREWMI